MNIALVIVCATCGGGRIEACIHILLLSSPYLHTQLVVLILNVYICYQGHIYLLACASISTPAPVRNHKYLQNYL